MDYILLGVCLLYALFGFAKGFVSSFFSLFSALAIAVGAYFCMSFALPLFENLLGDFFLEGVQSFLNSNISGTFDNMADFSAAVSTSSFGILGSILLPFIMTDVTFSGSMTAGDILGSSLNLFVIKVVCFVTLFVLIWIVIKILKLVLNKFIKKTKMSAANRLLGAVFGLCKGAVIFLGFFFVAQTLSVMTANVAFIDFVNGGPVSNFLYENITKIIINIFY